MTHNDTVTHKTEKPHSYEFGKAGNRFKLYFNTPAELDQYIKALGKWGFPVDNAYSITKEVDNNGNK